MPEEALMEQALENIPMGADPTALMMGNNPEAAMTAMGILGGIGIAGTIIYLAILVFMIIAYRKFFVKAGKPGRGIFIPFYNRYLMFKIGGRPGRRFLWILIPPVFAILMIILCFDRAKRFNKHRTFGLGLWLVPIVFIPILAFDKSMVYTPKQ